MTVEIDSKKIQVVHGEPSNLNGWGLAREQIIENTNKNNIIEMCEKIIGLQ
eukprot:UN04119